MNIINRWVLRTFIEKFLKENFSQEIVEEVTIHNRTCSGISRYLITKIGDVEISRVQIN